MSVTTKSPARLQSPARWTRDPHLSWKNGPARRYELRGIAKRFAIDNVAPMRPTPTLFRTRTWYCVIQLASLSLLLAEHIVRTGMLGELEHFLAYSGSASIAVAGYGWLGGARILGLF
jgi:hypothetical protein